MHPSLILMGTPDFGVPMFMHLIGEQFPIAAVVTQPDKPSGRGYHTGVSPVKRMALEAGLLLLQPQDVNGPDFLATIKSLNATAIVVAAFGQILKPALLELPALGCLNLHASLLPKYRGAAPIQWAIAHGEPETGVTVQRMALKVDSGPVLIQRKIEIGPDETTPELYQRLSALGGPAMVEALQLLAAKGPAAAVPQDEHGVSFAPRLRKTDGLINWERPALAIHNQVRAFNPWPGTFSYAQGELMKIVRSQRSEALVSPGMPPGTIVTVDKKSGWLVAAEQGSTLWVTRVQCENTKEMHAQAFTCGYRIGVGAVLGLKSPS